MLPSLCHLYDVNRANAVSAPNIGSRKPVSAYRSSAYSDEKKHVSVSALKNPYQSIHKGGDDDDDDDDDDDEDDEDDNYVFYSTFLRTDIIFIDMIYIYL